MSKYTTEVRYIVETLAGLTESAGYNAINTAITAAAPQIFSFSFPIWDETYRLTLETKILKHYYTREIGAETYGLWKLWLDETLNRIMPYYNQLYASTVLDFDPLYDVNYTREYQRTGDRSEQGTTTGSADTTTTEDGTAGTTRTGSTTRAGSTESTDVTDTETTKASERTEETAQAGSTSTSGSTSNTGTVTDAGTSGNTRWDLHSDTPQGGTSGLTLDGNGYLSDARKITDSGTNGNTRTDNTLQRTSTDGESANSGSLSSDGTENTVEHAGSAGSTSTSESGTNTETTTGSDSRTRAEIRESIEGLQKAITSTDAYVERIVGKKSGGSFMQMVRALRANILNIDEMIINDLEPLFIGLW